MPVGTCHPRARRANFAAGAAARLRGQRRHERLRKGSVNSPGVAWSPRVAGGASAVAGGGDDGAALVEKVLRTPRELGEGCVSIASPSGTRTRAPLGLRVTAVTGTWSTAARHWSFTVTCLAWQQRRGRELRGAVNDLQKLIETLIREEAHRRCRISQKRSSIGAEEDDGRGSSSLQQKPIKSVGRLKGARRSS